MVSREKKRLLRSPAILVVVFAVLLAMTGLVYTHWSTTARVEGQANTGGISISYWDHFTNDDGTVNTAFDADGNPIPWDLADDDFAAAFDMNVGYSSADPAGPNWVLEDFEDGNVDPWHYGGGNGLMQAVTSPPAPNGSSYVGEMTWTGSCYGPAWAFHPNEVGHHSTVRPDALSYYFRADSDYLGHPFGVGLHFASQTSAGGMALIGYHDGVLHYSLGGFNYQIIQPATQGVWYFIELRNIDWLGNTFDIWVDGVEQIVGAAFLEDVDELDFVQGFSCDASGPIYLDDIRLHEFNRYGKDVGHCHVGVEGDEEGEFLSIWVGNAYPSYYCTALAYVVNHGSVPIKAEIGSVVGAQQVEHVCETEYYFARVFNEGTGLWEYSQEVVATYPFPGGLYHGDDHSGYIDVPPYGDFEFSPAGDVRILGPNDNGEEFLDLDDDGGFTPGVDIEVFHGCNDVVTDLELEPSGPWVDALDPETGEPVVNLGFDQVLCGFQLDPAFDVFDEGGEYLFTEEPTHFPMQVRLHVKQPADPDTTYRFQVAQTFRNWNEFDEELLCGNDL